MQDALLQPHESGALWATGDDALVAAVARGPAAVRAFIVLAHCSVSPSSQKSQPAAVPLHISQVVAVRLSPYASPFPGGVSTNSSSPGPSVGTSSGHDLLTGRMRCEQVGGPVACP